MTDVRPEIIKIINDSRGYGWVLEPDAKLIFSLYGLDVPKFILARNQREALRFAHDIGYPVVAKVVSTVILHKSDVGGVVVGVPDDTHLTNVFARFMVMEGFMGVLIEEMVKGVELILGSKVDLQFGPMILLGIGGTGVEIYKDVSLRMAPLLPADVQGMLTGLKAHKLLEGYRGTEPANKDKIENTVIAFSNLVMDLSALIESIDINPLLCSSKRCVVADARIIL